MENSVVVVEKPGIIALVTMVTLAVIAMMATFVEHRKLHVISEASVSILLGLLIGVCYVYPSLHQGKPLPQFDQSIFFFILLPIILFKEGYTLNKQHFFKNFFYVMLYGLLGTIMNFIFVALLTLGASYADIIRLLYDQTADLTVYYSMFFGACISSKDSAVTLSVLDFNLTPKLHSIIFGEQILNDLVVFSLQKTVEHLGGPSRFINPNWYATLEFFGIIIEQLLVSLLVGLFVGLIATWLTTKCRWLVHHSSILTALTIYSGYISFALCESFQFCGVVAVLVCGVIMSHYLTYNIPKLSAQSSKITIKALAYISETFIYFYIGFSLWIQIKTPDTEQFQTTISLDYSGKHFIPWTLVVVQLFVIIPLSRFLSLIFTHLFAIVFRIKTKSTWRINRYEFFIIFYSGLIRGVVSYALVQELKSEDCTKVTGDEVEQQQCKENNSQLLYMQNTTLLIVLVSTLFIGGSLRYVTQKCYYYIEKNNFEVSQVYRESEEHRDSVSAGRLTLLGQSNDHHPSVSFIEADLQAYKNFKPKSESLFKKFDENILKPLLIYNYVQRKDDIREAKKLEKDKLRKEKFEDERMFDDHVRKKRLAKEERERLLADSHLTASKNQENDEMEMPSQSLH